MPSRRGTMSKRHPLFTHASPASAGPIACSHCKANAHLIWHSPLPAGLKGEMRIFECKACGKQIKMIVEGQVASGGSCEQLVVCLKGRKERTGQSRSTISSIESRNDHCSIAAQESGYEGLAACRPHRRIGSLAKFIAASTVTAKQLDRRVA